MGFFLSGTQFAPGVGPFLVGVIITFRPWQVAFWLQTALCGFGLILTVFFLPETCDHQLNKRRANGEKINWIWFNPFTPIYLLKYPNLLLTVLLSFPLSNMCRESQAARCSSVCTPS